MVVVVVVVASAGEDEASGVGPVGVGFGMTWAKRRPMGWRVRRRGGEMALGARRIVARDLDATLNAIVGDNHGGGRPESRQRWMDTYI